MTELGPGGLEASWRPELRLSYVIGGRVLQVTGVASWLVMALTLPVWVAAGLVLLAGVLLVAAAAAAVTGARTAAYRLTAATPTENVSGLRDDEVIANDAAPAAHRKV